MIAVDDLGNTTNPPEAPVVDRKVARPSRRAWRRGASLAAGPLSVVVFLGIWQIAGGRINPILLSQPTAVAQAFGHLARTGILWPAFARAMEDLLVGYLSAVVIGIGTGVLMGRHRAVERVLSPYVTFFQATPLIALTPLVVIWFGLGFMSEIAITFLLAVWTIIINTCEGVKSTPPLLLDMARIYHASERKVVRKIAIPNAVPYIFAGLKIAVAKALIGMIIAGMDITLKGLGGLVTTYGNEFQTASLLAAVITSSVVGVILTLLINVLRRVIAPWSINVEVKTKGRW
ncbi:MAG: transporter permease [Acidimicrobiaceae bacterium]|nr:transporter permease [Acidimicrobiaceae bacterium]